MTDYDDWLMEGYDDNVCEEKPFDEDEYEGRLYEDWRDEQLWRENGTLE